jgi:hypothetical protein
VRKQPSVAQAYFHGVPAGDRLWRFVVASI